MASITNSILDQIKLPEGVLESSCQSNSKTFIPNPISLRFGRENKGTYRCKLTATECVFQLITSPYQYSCLKLK